jgi:hypothetical protein
MLKPPVTFDAGDATANAQAKLVVREPRHLEMKWIVTERGFEPSWYVCPRAKRISSCGVVSWYRPGRNRGSN